VAYKTFKDPKGTKWEVWQVMPTTTDGRTVVSPGFEHGWLCFESDAGEKRRLAPVPGGWEDADSDKLWMWCRAATPVIECGPRP
jgi:hypothetical protein